MSDTKQKALDYLKSNADTKEVFATSDGFLFIKKTDAVEHAKTLNADNPEVETFTNSADAKQNVVKDDTKKPNPAELKAIKDKAIADYTELFGTAPAANLSAKKIQELIDAKKEELAKQNPDA